MILAKFKFYVQAIRTYEYVVGVIIITKRFDLKFKISDYDGIYVFVSKRFAAHLGEKSEREKCYYFTKTPSPKESASGNRYVLSIKVECWS